MSLVEYRVEAELNPSNAHPGASKSALKAKAKDPPPALGLPSATPARQSADQLKGGENWISKRVNTPCLLTFESKALSARRGSDSE